MAARKDRKHLAMALSRIPDLPRPQSRLEQVRTPGDVAADLLVQACDAGDITEKAVLDLGTGTGVLAIGAALLDARIVVAVDIDEASLEVARAAAEREGVADRIVFLRADVSKVTPAMVREHAGGPVDTVVMNPPFGADLASRARGGDRPFLSLAFRSAPVLYSLHAAETERFLVDFARSAGFETARAKVVQFALPGRFAHHKDLMRTMSVGVYRFARSTESAPAPDA